MYEVLDIVRDVRARGMTDKALLSILTDYLNFVEANPARLAYYLLARSSGNAGDEGSAAARDNAPAAAEDNAPATGSNVAIMYTEVRHTVVAAAPADAAPMSANGWKFQPGQVTLKYVIHTRQGDRSWRLHAVVTGSWLPKPGQVPRPGTACLLPWHESHFPAWLTALIAAHQPAWTPELPEAIVPAYPAPGGGDE